MQQLWEGGIRAAERVISLVCSPSQRIPPHLMTYLVCGGFNVWPLPYEDKENLVEGCHPIVHNHAGSRRCGHPSACTTVGKQPTRSFGGCMYRSFPERCHSASEALLQSSLGGATARKAPIGADSIWSWGWHDDMGEESLPGAVDMFTPLVTPEVTEALVEQRRL